MLDLKVDSVLDTQGLYCPEPVMMLHSKIRDMEIGETLLVEATDPSTVRDIPKFCLFLGHELISHTEQQNAYQYYIRKGEDGK
ncbi:MAG: sulfurtransferase TusA [Oceanospirillaceae bacterium]